MAIIYSNVYPGRFEAPTADYPHGAFRNRSAPDAKDGSYLEEQWLNDWNAFFSSILENAGVTPNGIVDKVGASQYFDALINVIQKSSPAGMVSSFAMQAAPNGWLKCDGSAVSRSTYSGLFAAIGTTFGAGNGSTTFNLPDMRGEFARGWDDGRNVDAGRAFGSSQADAIKEHDHYNGVGSVGFGSGADPFVYGSTIDDMPGLTDSKFSETTGAATHQGLTSKDGDTETRPRNVALLYCIKY